jgi:hypothetical protein
VVPRSDRVHFFSVSTHEAIGHTGELQEAGQVTSTM